MAALPGPTSLLLRLAFSLTPKAPLRDVREVFAVNVENKANYLVQISDKVRDEKERQLRKERLEQARAENQQRRKEEKEKTKMSTPSRKELHKKRMAKKAEKRAKQGNNM